MGNRLGFVGIVIDDRRRANDAVNRILSAYGDSIVARVGIPYRERNCCVITLVVDMTTDAIGSMTGQLGAIAGVAVKSALTKESG